MPTLIDQYVAEHDLGEPVAQWQPDSAETIARRTRSMVIRGGLAVVILLVAQLLHPWDQNWKTIVGLAGSLLGALWLIGTLIDAGSILITRRRRFRRTLLYTNGLLFTDGDRILDAYDLRTAAVAVRRVKYTGARGGVRIDVTVTDGDRRHVVSASARYHLRYVDDLAERLPVTAARAKAPVVLSRIAAGETIDFGTVALAPSGFGTGGSGTIPYHEYRAHDVVRGQLRITFGEPAASLEVPLADTRDFATVLTVIRALAAATPRQ